MCLQKAVFLEILKYVLKNPCYCSCSLFRISFRKLHFKRYNKVIIPSLTILVYIKYIIVKSAILNRISILIITLFDFKEFYNNINSNNSGRFFFIEYTGYPAKIMTLQEWLPWVRINLLRSS